ncbi:hypothetical protein BXZ70DRAFT_473549 [Cristinia sonorae]|uniref:FAD-binding PCMH-type domain-containing protein n=1 Tax=Cristinia sonorae TaxID=1940300 RepID=A0A8K0XLP8_9AGAR|nr:hypothetical protein BXZ70DRAFT_473549 [Cristinia sonorae]
MANLDDFKAKFKGDIVTPRDADYEQALDRWAANAKRRAEVVAFVKDPADVALAIKYARDAGLRIAIRGGGHSAAGTSSSEGGLVIDLSRYLNNVRVDPGQKLAYVQGGANWKTVDEASIKHGLAGVAGTVNHTGVGGLTVGGGYGWLSGLYGLVIDNTVQMTIVTADGSILDANETQNADLFWGVRGGGSNFGVVTEFVFKLHPQRPKVFAGLLVFPPDKVEQIGAFADEWWANVKPDEGMVIGVSRALGNPAIVALIFVNDSEAEGRKRLKKLFDIGPVVDQAKEIPYEELNAITNPMAEWGACYYFKGVLLSNTPAGDLNITKHQRFLDITARMPDHTVSIMHEYFPHAKINSLPADATPYRRDLPGNALIVIQWKENTPENAIKAKEAAHALAELAPEGEAYGNYTPDSDALPVAGAVSADKTKLLYRDNYPRLQAIKKNYDPNMVFNQWHTIVPA